MYNSRRSSNLKFILINSKFMKQVISIKQCPQLLKYTSQCNQGGWIIHRSSNHWTKFTINEVLLKLYSSIGSCSTSWCSTASAALCRAALHSFLGSVIIIVHMVTRFEILFS